jgi:hypothetical protein
LGDIEFFLERRVQFEGLSFEFGMGLVLSREELGVKYLFVDFLGSFFDVKDGFSEFELLLFINDHFETTFVVGFVDSLETDDLMFEALADLG